MMAGYLVAFPAGIRRTNHDVHSRSVVPLHVEIARRKIERPAIIQIPRDRKGL